MLGLVCCDIACGVGAAGQSQKLAPPVKKFVGVDTRFRTQGGWDASPMVIIAPRSSMVECASMKRPIASGPVMDAERWNCGWTPAGLILAASRTGSGSELAPLRINGRARSCCEVGRSTPSGAIHAEMTFQRAGGRPDRGSALPVLRLCHMGPSEGSIDPCDMSRLLYWWLLPHTPGGGGAGSGKHTS